MLCPVLFSLSYFSCNTASLLLLITDAMPGTLLPFILLQPYCSFSDVSCDTASLLFLITSSALPARAWPSWLPWLLIHLSLMLTASLSSWSVGIPHQIGAASLSFVLKVRSSLKQWTLQNPQKEGCKDFCLNTVLRHYQGMRNLAKGASSAVVNSHQDTFDFIRSLCRSYLCKIPTLYT